MAGPAPMANAAKRGAAGIVVERHLPHAGRPDAPAHGTRPLERGLIAATRKLLLRRQGVRAGPLHLAGESDPRRGAGHALEASLAALERAGGIRRQRLLVVA